MKNLILMMIVSVFVLSACVKQQVAGHQKVSSLQSHALMGELQKGISIYFNKNSTQIDAEYEKYLRAAAEILALNNQFILDVIGHTDSSGSAVTNRRVSNQRANQVKMILVTQYHVNPNQINAVGVGSDQPIADNQSNEGRSQNRRVSLTLKNK